jgi:hypothetical protein
VIGFKGIFQNKVCERIKSMGIHNPQLTNSVIKDGGAEEQSIQGEPSPSSITATITQFINKNT